MLTIENVRMVYPGQRHGWRRSDPVVALTA